MVTGVIDTSNAFFVTVKSTSPNGFGAMGTTSWGLADFDNFLVEPTN